MPNLLTISISFIAGCLLTVVALALVRGNSKNIVKKDPEREEIEKQWEEQSKGY